MVLAMYVQFLFYLKLAFFFLLFIALDYLCQIA